MILPEHQIPTTHRTIVIGDGLQGLAIAAALHANGMPSLVLSTGESVPDPSCAKACLLAPPCQILPLSTPDSWRRVCRRILHPFGPMVIRLRDLPGCIPWLLRVNSFANDEATRRITRVWHVLSQSHLARHAELAARLGLPSPLQEGELDLLYRSERVYRADGYAHMLRKGLGIEWETITPDRETPDPDLAYDRPCIARFSQIAWIPDLTRYCAELREGLTTHGIAWHEGTPLELLHRGGKVTAVRTDTGTISCANLIVASDKFAAPLCATIGLSLPILSHRQTAVRFIAPNYRPKHATWLGDTDVALWPEPGGFVAIGHSSPALVGSPQLRRATLSIRQAIARHYPAISYLETKAYTLAQALLSDGLPAIGPCRLFEGIYLAIGLGRLAAVVAPEVAKRLVHSIKGVPEDRDSPCVSELVDPRRFG